MSRPKLLIAASAVLVAILAFAYLPLEDWLLVFVENLRQLGWLGVVGFAVVYVVCTVFLLPASLLTLAAGFVYGPVLGLAIVSPVSVAAATAAFVVGRYFAKDWVEKKSRQNERFAAIDKAIQARGFRVVLLLRLSPVFPFNLLNYLLALTTLRLRDYALASAIGMLPGTAMYVYFGSLITSISQIAAGDRPSGGAAQSTLYMAGLLATIVVTVWLTKVARTALATELQPTSNAD